MSSACISLAVLFQPRGLLSWKNTETWSQKESGFSAHPRAPLTSIFFSLFCGKCCSLKGQWSSDSSMWKITDDIHQHSVNEQIDTQRYTRSFPVDNINYLTLSCGSLLYSHFHDIFNFLDMYALPYNSKRSKTAKSGWMDLFIVTASYIFCINDKIFGDYHITM